jgi:hypothetical protein
MQAQLQGGLAHAWVVLREPEEFARCLAAWSRGARGPVVRAMGGYVSGAPSKLVARKAVCSEEPVTRSRC